MSTTTNNRDNLLTLHYGRKDRFNIVCGLNDKGLVPGQSLTENHISKQACIDIFDDQKANNGYKVGKGSEFRDRVLWLWKRVHQADRPPNNDVGLRFCQGILYEHRHGQDTVDWAQFAVNTVKWFHASKGLTKVHDDWAYAYPSMTIDVLTGKRVCSVHRTQLVEGVVRTFKVPTTSPGGEAKKRRVENLSTESAPQQTGASKVKLEYIPVHVPTSPAEIPTQHPSPEASSLGGEELPSTNTPRAKIPIPKASVDCEDMPSGSTPSPKMPSSKVPTSKTLEGFEDVPSGSNPTLEVPSSKVPTSKSSPVGFEEVPSKKPSNSRNSKAFASPKEMPSGCTPALLNALQLFRVDIERAINVSMKDLEEQKLMLKTVLDQNRHDVEVATTTVKNLEDDLENAKKILLGADTDDNRGEVRWIQSAIKSGERKLNSSKAKYNEVLMEWGLQMKLLTEKSQAQKILETHFRFKDEEAKPFDL